MLFMPLKLLSLIIIFASCPDVMCLWFAFCPLTTYLPAALQVRINWSTEIGGLLFMCMIPLKLVVYIKLDL